MYKCYGFLSLTCRSTKVHGHNRPTGLDVFHFTMGLFKLLHIVLKCHKQTLGVLRSQNYPLLNFCLGYAGHHPYKVQYKLGR